MRAQAYEEVYDSYHGWIVRKIFMTSFKAAPSEMVIFRAMVGEEAAAAIKHREENHKTLDSSSSPPNARKSTNLSVDGPPPYAELPRESQVHRLPQQEQLGGSEGAGGGGGGGFLDGLGRNIGKAWEDLLKPWVKLLGLERREDNPPVIGLAKRELKAAGGGPNGGSSKDGAASGGTVTKQGEIDREIEVIARNQLEYFLKIMKPVVEDLELIFDELNMNDPTVV